MSNIQDIHGELMDSIGEAIKKADLQISQIDPSGENCSLNLVIDITAIGTHPISGEQFPLAKGIIYEGWRGNLAYSAAGLTVTVSTAPASSSHPEGQVGNDYVKISAILDISDQNQRFSVN
jgi:hypothetical protein